MPAPFRTLVVVSPDFLGTGVPSPLDGLAEQLGGLGLSEHRREVALTALATAAARTSVELWLGTTQTGPRHRDLELMVGEVDVRRSFNGSAVAPETNHGQHGLEARIEVLQRLVANRNAARLIWADSSLRSERLRTIARRRFPGMELTLIGHEPQYGLLDGDLHALMSGLPAMQAQSPTEAWDLPDDQPF